MERKQLHRLISRHTWIFGDEYFLVNDDEALTNVLRQHIKHVAPAKDLTEPVLCGDESDEDGVVDVVLGKELPRGPNEMKHKLVIELKRPTQKISTEVLSQVRKYAFAIEKDPSFSTVPTQWTFWAVSNDMSEDGRIESEQDGRPQGVVFTRSSRAGSMTIWSKTWAQVIEQCRGRLQFFQQQLQYNVSHSSGLTYLQATYEKFIPTLPKPEESTGNP